LRSLGVAKYSYIVTDIVSDTYCLVVNSEGQAMKISARNALAGKIVEIKKGAATAHVRVDVGGTIMTASITNESRRRLEA